MQTAINVKRLSKSYGNKPAVDNISLSVKRGTVFGLLGANATGKSAKCDSFHYCAASHSAVNCLIDC